jgi:TatD DNase family protein
MFIDTHVHLDFDPLSRDPELYIMRAQDADVLQMINVGSNLKGSRNSVALAGKHDCIHATVGIHPHDANTVADDALAELRSLAQNKKVLAIGEIGLDYFKMRTPKEVQIKGFKTQLDLARECKLPVVVHTRGADSDILKILDEYSDLKCVIHFFSSTYDMSRKLLDMGHYLSFTGVITFSRKSGPTPDELERTKVIRDVPLDRMMIETDSPFAAPEPFRGRPCEPAYVVEVARKISEIRGISIDEVAEATTANCRQFFSL